MAKKKNPKKTAAAKTATEQLTGNDPATDAVAAGDPVPEPPPPMVAMASVPPPPPSGGSGKDFQTG